MIRLTKFPNTNTSNQNKHSYIMLYHAIVVKKIKTFLLLLEGVEMEESGTWFQVSYNQLKPSLQHSRNYIHHAISN